MAVLKRLLHQRATGPVGNDEDWWRLVFDTDAGRLYVEHEWEHTDVRGLGVSNKSIEQIDIESFLLQPGQSAAHRELCSLLERLFEDGNA